MAQHTFTKVTNQSYFQRLGKSFKNVVGGLLLFLIAFPLLFWNEGRSVKRYKTLQEGIKKVVTIDASKIDPTNEGNLVHLSGNSATTDVLNDAQFGVSLNKIKLNRTVEMYQWEEKTSSEEREKLGGGVETTTTYDYEKTWSNSLINSSNFEYPSDHQNPATKQFDDQEFVATNVTVGAFKLSPGLIGKINNYTDLGLTDAMIGKLPINIRGNTKISSNRFYIGQNPSDPQIGDLKVGFTYVEPGPVSIVARQLGSTFEPYKTDVGGMIELLEIGTVSSENMFATAVSENVMITWVLRILGFVLMFVGLGMILRPISTLGSVIPLLGNIAGTALNIIAFLIALAFSTLTIGLAWIIYRPLLGIALIAVSIGAFIGLKKLTKNSPEGEKPTS